MIKLVSGYHSDSKIYMLSSTEYVISWVISPLLYSPSVSPVLVSVSPHRAPSETKQSATNSRVANIDPADSDPVITGGSSVPTTTLRVSAGINVQICPTGHANIQ